MTWQTGRRPPKHGYYLAAWSRGKRYIVSEMWFNPNAIGTGWFASRGYLGNRDNTHETYDVVAWMPMPEYKPS